MGRRPRGGHRYTLQRVNALEQLRGRMGELYDLAAVEMLLWWDQQVDDLTALPAWLRARMNGG